MWAHLLYNLSCLIIFFGGFMDRNYYVRDIIQNQELLLDVVEDNPYGVITSLAIWLYSLNIWAIVLLVFDTL